MFVFGLAKGLGMTVEHLLKTMSSDELTYWKAYSVLVEEELDWIQKKGGK